MAPVDLADQQEMLDMLDVLIAVVSGDEKSAHASIMTRTEFIEKMKGNFKQWWNAVDTDGNDFIDKVEFLACIDSISGNLGERLDQDKIAHSLRRFAELDTNKVTACGSNKGSKCQHSLPPEQCSVILD